MVKEEGIGPLMPEAYIIGVFDERHFLTYIAFKLVNINEIVHEEKGPAFGKVSRLYLDLLWLYLFFFGKLYPQDAVLEGCLDVR